VTADILMDILLFPMLSESLKEHHIEIVNKHLIFFALVPVWIIGCIFFEKRKNKLGVIISGSALVATIVFAFTSLPFIWIADTFPLLASTFLFCHDYGLYIYFFIMISIFGYKYFKRHYKK
jgi:hypothetical protein